MNREGPQTTIRLDQRRQGESRQARANLRSPWDTLHPGREWAWRDPNMANARPPDRIIADLREHFASEPVYADLDQILREFVEELRQL